MRLLCINIEKQRLRCLAPIAAAFLLPSAAHPSERIGVSFQYARPVLQWSNHVGDAYVIEITSNLMSGVWQQKTVSGKQGEFYSIRQNRISCRDE